MKRGSISTTSSPFTGRGEGRGDKPASIFPGILPSPARAENPALIPPRKRGGWISRLLSAIALSTFATSLHAQSPDAAFYAGKTVRFVVGSSAGGGYDTYARLIQPYLAKTLGANVVVENVPGAGGLTALDRVNRAEPDGLTIMIVHGVAASFAQLFGAAGVRFDLPKMSHLGMVSNASRVWVRGPNAPFRDFAQAKSMSRPMIWPATSPLRPIPP
mgnify:FL=1